ncbi:MAG: alpha-ketoglutarate-dependent dioxygenase AlkB family protein [Geminicoccaceae bacterium]
MRRPVSSNLLPCDGEALLFDDALSTSDSDRAFDLLLDEIGWSQEHAVLFGRRVALPRLTAWYGEHGYRYSGVHHRPTPLTPTLADLKISVEAIANTGFNSVLLNLYRDGQDSMGWHSDDEAVLGPDPEIASLSLGAERRFHFKHRASGERISLDLGHGSCLIMRGSCQAFWQHRLPKTRRNIGPRINLTFRSTCE